MKAAGKVRKLLIGLKQFFSIKKRKQYFHPKLLWYHPKITYKNIVQKDMNKFFDKEMYLNLLMWWGGRHKHVKFGHCMPMSSRSWPAKNCEGSRASAKKKGLYRWCLKLQHPSPKKLWWVSSTFHTRLFLHFILVV